MSSQEKPACNPDGVGSSLTCIEFDIMNAALSCIKDVNSRGEARIDFHKLAKLTGYPSVDSMRAQWRTMQKTMAEICAEVKAAEVEPAVPVPNNRTHNSISKQREDITNQRSRELQEQVNQPRVRANNVRNNLHLPKRKDRTLELFDEKTQRMWDEGLISDGFGPDKVFGTVLVPPPPPAGFGFGMGVYNNIDDNEDPSFTSWK